MPSGYIILLVTCLTLCTGWVNGQRNLARGRQVGQSSTYNNVGVLLIADNAVDGNTANFFLDYTKDTCTSTISEYKPWLAVDLQQSVVVTSVVLTIRGGQEGRIANLNIGVSNSRPVLGLPTTSVTYTLCGTLPALPINGVNTNVQCAANMPASRYVILQLPGTNLLEVCEIEVYGNVVSRLNLALGRATTQSTDFVYPCRGNGVPLYASYAVDGSTATFNSSGTGLVTASTTWVLNPWWSVELGSLTKVTQVIVTPANDASLGQNIAGAIIGVTFLRATCFDIPVPGTYPVCGTLPNPMPTPLGTAVTINCDANLIPGRYLHIQKAGWGALDLAEVEVYSELY